MIEIAFVILQYKGFQDTIQCVESIRKKIDTDSYAIIVVDNASPDGSCEEIERYIQAASEIRIIFIKNEQNLGFAKGNNMGIQYIRENLDARFIAVINNDIELISNNMVGNLEQKFLSTNFSVLGPLILSGDGKYISNPMAKNLFSLYEIRHEIRHTKRILILNEARLLGIYSFFKSLRKKENKIDSKNICIQEQVNVKLHGCFLIFSPTFFTKLKGFNPSTFLYMEEDILLFELQSNNLLSLYTPDICAFHKEGSSTARVKEYERVKFIFSNRLRSQNIYKNLLEQTKCEGAQNVLKEYE